MSSSMLFAQLLKRLRSLIKTYIELGSSGLFASTVNLIPGGRAKKKQAATKDQIPRKTRKQKTKPDAKKQPMHE